jgi:thiamine monophosphate kinase
VVQHEAVGPESGSGVRPKRSKIVGLYTDPPSGSTLACVDELGPSLPALSLRLRDGRRTDTASKRLSNTALRACLVKVRVRMVSYAISYEKAACNLSDGEWSHVRSYRTSADAFHRGYKVVAPEHCVEAFTDEDHQRSLEYLKADGLATSLSFTLEQANGNT